MEKTVIRSKRIIDSGEIIDGYILIGGGKILDLRHGWPQGRDWGAGIIDAGDCYVSAGFIDMHTHGGGGADFMDGGSEYFLTAASEHMRHGTTCIIPTTLTCTPEALLKTIDDFKEAKKASGIYPHIPGLHLEGPYLNIEQAGAQDARYIKKPDIKEYRNIIEYADGGIIRWSVAPELDGAMEMGDYLRGCGILPSIAHTNADYDTVRDALSHGYTLLTHFYSTMSTITRKKGYRVLGVIESGYIIDDMDVEIIADGCHLPPALLGMIYKIKSPDRVALVTDSMRGAGMPDGPSVLGGLDNGMEVIIEDGVAKLKDRSAFAGSVATADRLVRVMCNEAGIGIKEAVKMITQTPARIMGLLGSKGTLTPGKDADVVIFDDNITIQAVIISGKSAYYNNTKSRDTAAEL